MTTLLKLSRSISIRSAQRTATTRSVMRYTTLPNAPSNEHTPEPQAQQFTSGDLILSATICSVLGPVALPIVACYAVSNELGYRMSMLLLAAYTIGIIVITTVVQKKADDRHRQQRLTE